MVAAATAAVAAVEASAFAATDLETTLTTTAVVTPPTVFQKCATCFVGKSSPLEKSPPKASWKDRKLRDW